VACVIQRGDRLLVCQRPAAKRHGGLWEFPGGKAEPGETDEQAAQRELGEELGVTVVAALPALFEVADEGSPYLIAFVPVTIAGEPRCIEHQQMRWCSPSAMGDLPFAPSDNAFVQFLHTLALEPS
jgi:8-oxo-dGTP diphosphatase